MGVSGKDLKRQDRTTVFARRNRDYTNSGARWKGRMRQKIAGWDVAYYAEKNSAPSLYDFR